MVDRLGRLGGLFSRSTPSPLENGSPEPPAGTSLAVPDMPIRLSFMDPDLEARRRVLVFLLGVSAGDLGRLVDAAARGLDPRRDLAVFVVSNLDFASLRERGVMFEYLPSADDLGAREPEPYAAYVRRRLSILRLKWDAAAEIEMGRPFESWLSDNVALAASSPV